MSDVAYFSIQHLTKAFRRIPAVNDVWLDIFTLDMKPSEEQILKTTPSVDDYNIFDFKLDYGYQAQYPRKMLQINQPQHRDSFLRYG